MGLECLLSRAFSLEALCAHHVELLGVGLWNHDLQQVLV
jgi:hypothetical protein